jgi:hypothetical protein
VRHDRDVVLEAVQQNGCALNFATDELRRDRGTWRCGPCSMQQTGHALKYANSTHQRKCHDLLLDTAALSLRRKKERERERERERDAGVRRLILYS